MKRTAYSPQKMTKFSTFDEFQSNLTAILETSDYINKLEVTEGTNEKKMVLSVGGKLLKVEKLKICSSCTTPASILEQVDPNYLIQLEMRHDGFDPKVFDMPQVVNARVLVIDESFISSDQLLKLKCYAIKYGGPQKRLPEMVYRTQWRNFKEMTLKDINNYIEHCITKLDNEPVAFKIKHELRIPSTKKVFFDSPSGKYQLAIRYDNGAILGETHGKTGLKKNDGHFPSTLRAVEYIELFRQIENKLVIKEINRGAVHYVFESEDELHDLLTEELKGIDRIDQLYLFNATRNWKVCAPSDRNLTIRKLIVQENTGIEFLDRINSRHLEEIIVHGYWTIDKDFYDMPQVIHAKKLKISDCIISDEQLLKLDAVHLTVHISKNRCNLTNSGINKFIRKHFETSNPLGFDLNFFFPEGHIDSSEIFESFDIADRISHYDREWKIIVNSPNRNFQMELNRYMGTREVAKKAELTQKKSAQKKRNSDNFN